MKNFIRRFRWLLTVVLLMPSNADGGERAPALVEPLSLLAAIAGAAPRRRRSSERRRAS